MGKDLRNRFLVILGATLASLLFTFPLDKHINLGLDLKGGMHLILKVDNEKLDPKVRNDAVLKAIEILRNRIDSLGVGETIIQRQGENQILVQLPGVTNRDAAHDIIGRVAQLEFRVVAEDPTLLTKTFENNNTPPAGYVLRYIKKENNEPIILEDTIAMSGERIADARVDFSQDSLGQPQISLRFNSQGSKEFGALTQKNVRKRLAIILDDEVLSAPVINEPILGGNAQITGKFSFEEASLLALALRSGALPAPMHIEEERTIGPLLGRDSIEAGIKATVIGLALVFVFMAGYYLLAGMIANFALILNALLILGFMGFLNVMLPQSQSTLTLPGIAGIILTLGMAVDANVIINERIREELRNGQTLAGAISTGYSRAMRAIIDSHVTNLIAAFFLFQFGSGPIKGFAVTLSIGILASLFTSIYVTQTIFNYLLKTGRLKKLPMASVFGHTKINFVSMRYVCLGISFLLAVASIVLLIKKGEHAYGIDFAGGQIQEYKFSQPISPDQVRAALKEANINDAVLQQFNNLPENIIVRTPEDSDKQVNEAFKKAFPNLTFDIMRIEKVGPIVGKHLRQVALLAIICALGGILIYVGFRFKHFDFAVAGVIALAHDVVIAMGAVLITGRQIDLLVITALLTIAGYSINDTIIVYDRIRENMQKMKKSSLREIINLSVNQTLSRTILTAGVTLLVVFALYIWGGQILNSFAFCLLVGFSVGVYSSVYVAAPIVIAWHKDKS